ncbi:hypothetical protein SDC9_189184 [bioreactor metagenome]|uniref:WCX domain-containing protein n=1 Tax=bioreactor metagenome TaxID=1076179 RepID=A0A645HS03_9ZZZZ
MDRICNPEVTDREAEPKPENFNVGEYTKQVFQMYDADIQTVELRCANKLMKVIIDRFGEDVETKLYDNDNFTVTIDVAPSPTFFGWVFQFAGNIQIISPEPAVDKFKSIAMSFCL